MERKKIFFVSGILIALLIIILFFFFQKNKNIKIFTQKLTSTPESSTSVTSVSEIEENKTTSPAPENKLSNYNLPDEPIGFSVMSGPGQTPIFLSGWFSRRVPLVKPGEEFDVKIEIQDEKGVSKVVFVIQSEDKKIEKEFQMNLKEGNSKKGTWQTKVRVSQEIPTIWYSYFKAENKEGKVNTLTFNWK
jgi:hypothetical protein